MSEIKFRPHFCDWQMRNTKFKKTMDTTPTRYSLNAVLMLDQRL